MARELRTPDISTRTTIVLVTIALMTGALLRSCGLRFGFPNPLAGTDEEVLFDLGLGVLSDPNPHSTA